MRPDELNILFKKIKNNTFNKSDIESLLIQCRSEISSKDILLKEVCHCLAHSERNTGLLYENVILLHLRFLRQFSVGAITNLFFGEKLNEDYFKSLKSIVNNRLQCSDQLKHEAYKFIKENFIKKDHLTSPKPSVRRSQLHSFIDLIIAHSPTELTVEWVLKGLISYSRIFERKYLLEREHYYLFIGKYSREIGLCVLSILHNIQFRISRSLTVRFQLSMNEGKMDQLDHLDQNKLKICIVFNAAGVSAAVPVINSNLRALRFIDDFMIGMPDPLDFYPVERNTDGLFKLRWQKSIERRTKSLHISINKLHNNLYHLPPSRRETILKTDEFVQQTYDQNGLKYHLAVAHFEKEEYEKANELLAKITSTEGMEFPILRLKLGIAKYLKLDCTEIINALKSMYDNMECDIAIAHYYSEVDYEQSKLYVEKVLKGSELTLSEFQIIAKIFVENNDIKNFRKLVETYIELIDTEACFDIGTYYLTFVKDFNKAVFYLRTAYYNSPYDAGICLNLAEAYYHSGNEKRFNMIYKKAILLDPNMATYLDKIAAEGI